MPHSKRNISLVHATGSSANTLNTSRTAVGVASLIVILASLSNCISRPAASATLKACATVVSLRTDYLRVASKIIHTDAATCRGPGITMTASMSAAGTCGMIIANSCRQHQVLAIPAESHLKGGVQVGDGA